jgi:cysteine desulfuration protein SufE
MSDPSGPQTLPPSIERVLKYFRSLGREEKMQALVAYSKRLEPVPERFKSLPREAFSVPECMTPVDLFPEERDGRMHFYADVNPRQSPTVAAFLAVLFQAVNDQAPATILAIPSDFVRQMMEGIGLAAREPGLNAILSRVKRHAAAAAAA